MQPFERILCPVDFSDCSRTALKAALELRQRFNAKLDVLHAYHVPHTLRPNLLVWAAAGPRPIVDLGREEGEAAMQKFLASVGLTRVDDLNVTIVHQAPADAIIEYAAQQGNDLIVMGIHGHTAAARWLLGAVTEHVVRRAPCPVLTVHLNEDLAASRSEPARPKGATRRESSPTRPAGSMGHA
jgi:nucleotide-binding universal stress UspA family protein